MYYYKINAFSFIFKIKVETHLPKIFYKNMTYGRKYILHIYKYIYIYIIDKNYIYMQGLFNRLDELRLKKWQSHALFTVTFFQGNQL